MSTERAIELAVGDPVTVVTWWNGEILADTIAVIRPGEEIVTKRVYIRPITEEGITWIRGHHDIDSNVVQAMLAARALTMGAER